MPHSRMAKSAGSQTAQLLKLLSICMEPAGFAARHPGSTRTRHAPRVFGRLILYTVTAIPAARC